MNLYFFESTPYEFFAFTTLFVLLLIQLRYILFVYARVAFTRIKQSSKQNDINYLPVSVIICARNEEQNLAEFLPQVLEQDYSNYEVVVVNDCSIDDTDMVLKRLQEKYKHLKVTTIKPDPKFSHGKKLALTVGIKAASNSWLLLTDADCKPESSSWIKSMAENFTEKADIVLGYGGYIQKKGLLNKIIRFDTFQIAIQYLGFALAKKPYMGVGRNLAYKKELFFANKGFASHSHILSGDDDLFIQQVASKTNTAVELRHNAHTRSKASSTFAEWIGQKRRHLTTSPSYKGVVKFRLALEPLSRILFWALGIYLLATNFYPIVVGSILMFRLIVAMVILKITMNRLNEKKIFIISLIYDLFSPLFYGAIMLASRLTLNHRKWK